ncbi:FAD-binding oxidoreductase [Salinisphaera sp. USBA-960]|uniref:NAD(P)/FAD-dependent oxidoreductase n=1 Tax=Salinisphaera orenii TaxID=856731 RepID=UPI000DBE82C6|nr:FAD-binding oxidoreductase [Salifodinibacter halophilus]NNC27183.1 FAD-binding oxidoreductase [Salifodinibacter halophilus]
MAGQREIAVLGAGMVGVCVAVHLQKAGHNVVLVDRKAPGQETSYGNAGLIQREAVEPHPFPRDIGTLWRVLPNRSIDIRYRASAMVGNAGALAQYWRYSSTREFERIVPEYASLIEQCTAEHDGMIKAAAAESLVRSDGWLQLFRHSATLEAEAAKAEDFRKRFGVEFKTLDSAALAQAEPALNEQLAGAIHWTNAWSVVDPGALVQAYADDFVAAGGTIETADITDISHNANGWRLHSDSATIDADGLVLATGPWSKPWLESLGYALPLFVMRGYHMHYAYPESGQTLSYGIMDFEKGYLVTPKRAGLRLTTGAELNSPGAPPNYGQLNAAESVVQSLVTLGARSDPEPWLGARPCLPDMKPIIGPAPAHRKLWFAFGHGHQGFTLGAVTGRMIREMVDGEEPFIDPVPYRAERFI